MAPSKIPHPNATLYWFLTGIGSKLYPECSGDFAGPPGPDINMTQTESNFEIRYCAFVNNKKNLHNIDGENITTLLASTSSYKSKRLAKVGAALQDRIIAPLLCPNPLEKNASNSYIRKPTIVFILIHGDVDPIPPLISFYF